MQPHGLADRSERPTLSAIVGASESLEEVGGGRRGAKRSVVSNFSKTSEACSSDERATRLPVLEALLLLCVL